MVLRRLLPAYLEVFDVANLFDLDDQVFRSCVFWIFEESYPAMRYLSEAVVSMQPKSLPTICFPEGIN
jgi:hypothetical protein